MKTSWSVSNTTQKFSSFGLIACFLLTLHEALFSRVGLAFEDRTWKVLSVFLLGETWICNSYVVNFSYRWKAFMSHWIDGSLIWKNWNKMKLHNLCKQQSRSLEAFCCTLMLWHQTCFSDIAAGFFTDFPLLFKNNHDF